MTHTFDHEKAITRFTELMKLIDVGAYQERDHEGNYGEDGIEEAADGLSYQAAQHRREFHWHKDTQTYTLEVISAENKAEFLHVNVEQLISLLTETSHYLHSLPYESEIEKNARAGLQKRIEEALKDSYRVPVLLETESE